MFSGVGEGKLAQMGAAKSRSLATLGLTVVSPRDENGSPKGIRDAKVAFCRTAGKGAAHKADELAG